MFASEKQQLNAVSRHLQQHRDQVLEAWRSAVQADLELITSSSLSRIALDDHLPSILETFENHLLLSAALRLRTCMRTRRLRRRSMARVVGSKGMIFGRRCENGVIFSSPC